MSKKIKLQKKLPSSTPIMILFEGSYLGDIDIDGFEITTQKEWDEHLEIVEKMYADAGEHASFERFFGTHESIAFDSFESYKKHFKVVPIPNKQVEDFLKKNFKLGFGHFLALEELDILESKEREKEVRELVDKKKPIIAANFFDNLRMDKRWR